MSAGLFHTFLSSLLTFVIGWLVFVLVFKSFASPMLLPSCPSSTQPTSVMKHSIWGLPPSLPSVLLSLLPSLLRPFEHLFEGVLCNRHWTQFKGKPPKRMALALPLGFLGWLGYIPQHNRCES